MKNLKLNKLVENQLSEKEKNEIKGGEREAIPGVNCTGRWIGDPDHPGYLTFQITCGCACAYAGQKGGSSTADNCNANSNGGLFSPQW